MKRRMVLAAALMAVVVLASSAQMRERGGAAIDTPGLTEAQEVELTGRLRLERDQLPVLVAADREYTLRIAPALGAELDVATGQEVAVAGYLMERASRDLLGTTAFVMVRAIEVNGTRYVMPVIGHMRGDVPRTSGPAPRGRIHRRP